MTQVPQLYFQSFLEKIIENFSNRNDPNLNKQIKTSLEDNGYSVDFAVDGRRPFLGDTEPYDAVILDLGLPKIDGITILKG